MPRKRSISADRVFVDARPELGEGVIKSAQRVLHLFELFSDVRTGVTVADVAARLNMPQSSTSALLRSLHTLGYLDVQQEDRTYLPTSRVALLGHWIDPLLTREGPILQMARQVSAEIGFDTFLALRNKLHVQVAFRHHSVSTRSHSLTGAGSFMVVAATGHVLMSDMSDGDIIKLVTATNALSPSGLPLVNPGELIQRIAQVRQDGFACGRSQRSQENLTIAVRLPQGTANPMAFGVSLPRGRVGENPRFWGELLKNAVREWLPSD